MSQLAALLGLVLPFFGLIGLGILSARLARLPDSGLAWMQFFLVYLALPALFFRLLADKPIAEVANGRFAVLTTLATALAFGLSFLIARLTTPRLPDAVIGGVSGSYSNIGYMGPPLVTSFLGTAASAPVALIFVFDTLFLFTVVPMLMSLGGTGERRPGAVALEALRRIVLHPFLLATAAGIAASLFAWQPPEPVDRMLGWLSGAAAPCALFALGVSVASRPAGRIGAATGLAVAVKLLAHPIGVWVLLSWLGDPDPVWIQAAVIMAALPPALNVFVLAAQYRAGIEQASACVLAGTIASTVTLTAFLWLFRTGALPPVLFRG